MIRVCSSRGALIQTKIKEREVARFKNRSFSNNPCPIKQLHVSQFANAEMGGAVTIDVKMESNPC
mgnify:CR=1 FL=1